MTDPLRQLEAELGRLRELRDRMLSILRDESLDQTEKLRRIEAAAQVERDLDEEAEEAGDRERLS